MNMIQISDLEYSDNLEQIKVSGGRFVSVSVDTGTFVDIRLSVGRRSADLSYGLATGLAAGISLNDRAIADVRISAFA